MWWVSDVFFVVLLSCCWNSSVVWFMFTNLNIFGHEKKPTTYQRGPSGDEYRWYALFSHNVGGMCPVRVWISLYPKPSALFIFGLLQYVVCSNVLKYARPKPSATRSQVVAVHCSWRSVHRCNFPSTVFAEKSPARVRKSLLYVWQAPCPPTFFLFAPCMSLAF